MEGKHMKIGHFRQEGELYVGNIYGIGFAVPHVVFSRTTAKSGNSPDYAVTGAPDDDERDFEIGAAWTKTSKKGKAYLSVKLDGPTLAQPINCALIEDSLGTFRLMWNRSETDKAEVGEGA